MRQGGLGIGAFYTPTGVGTFVEYGKVPIRFKPGTPFPDMVSKPKEVIFIYSFKRLSLYHFHFREEFSMVDLILWKKQCLETFLLSRLRRLIEKETFTTTELLEISMMTQYLVVK